MEAKPPPRELPPLLLFWPNNALVFRGCVAVEMVVVAVIVVTPVPLRETDCEAATVADWVGGGVSFSRLVVAEELLLLLFVVVLADGDKLVIELVADVEMDDPCSPPPPTTPSLDKVMVAVAVSTEAVPSLLDINGLLLAALPAPKEAADDATGTEDEHPLICG